MHMNDNHKNVVFLKKPVKKESFSEIAEMLRILGTTFANEKPIYVSVTAVCHGDDGDLHTITRLLIKDGGVHGQS